MKRTILALFVSAMVSSAAWGQAGATPPTKSCESLAQVAVPQTKIISAEMVAAGAFTPPAGAVPPGMVAEFKKVPAFCRVRAQATPSADSDVEIEVWMPAANWNGRFQAQGNGGFAGYIDYGEMGKAVALGYATASTDTGHKGNPIDATWALGHPEKVVDFGYRAIHEMTQVAKAAIKAFYGEAPRRSYFGSCSNGGRQALMEAQRFPEDYDGIIAGAPANYWTHLLTSAVWDAQALTRDPGAYIPPSKIPAIASAVNAACDAQDGVADGIINDPRKCHFDGSSMLCKDGDSDSCLTAAQVNTLKELYEGAHDSTGHQIFPGFLPGAEAGEGGWQPWIVGSAPGKSLLFAFGSGFFADMVYGQADWNIRNARLDDVVKAADEKMARVMNSTDPNLAAFKTRGGKLIVYHGWNDPAISAVSTINYYNTVVQAMGENEVNSFVRVYMVPGMQHCGSGPGPFRFGEPGSLKPPSPDDPQHDVTLALEQWVEKGTAPATMVTTKYVADDPAKGVEMTRPLCPYPEAAKYKGTGNTNDASNFVCSDGK